jgi:hypothetical protein
MSGPLAFVNWRSVNRKFCTLMWIVAFVLAVAIVLAGLPPEGSAHHVARSALH